MKQTTTSNQSGHNSDQKPDTMKNYFIRNGPFLALSTTLVALIFGGQIDSYGVLHRTLPASLTDFASRIRFTLQQQTLGVSWLLFSIGYVAYKRGTTPAFDPVSGNERYAEMAHNNLRNTVEQLVMLSLSQLILVTHLSAETIVQLIPAVNFAFFVGRVTFWLGYPRYRPFGFTLTSIPTVVMIGFNLYMFAIN